MLANPAPKNNARTPLRTQTGVVHTCVISHMIYIYSGGHIIFPSVRLRGQSELESESGVDIEIFFIY